MHRLAAGFLLLASFFSGCRSETISVSPLVGKPAPDVAGNLLDGEPFELRDHHADHVVMLDFWATWCGPCILELPVLMKLADEFKDRGVVLYTINDGEEADTVRNFLTENNLQMNVVLDSQRKWARAYNVNGIPQLVLIDRQGIVKHVHVGYHSDIENKVRQELNDLLSNGKTINERPTELP